MPRMRCRLELGCSRVGTFHINAIRLFSWLTLALLSFPSGVFAFTEPAFYGNPTSMGGTAGRYFTGSPADGYGCSACHTGPGSLPLSVTGIPAGGYVPGQPYVIRIAWPDATFRANAAIAANVRPSIGLVAEFVAEDGSDSGIVALEPQFAGASELCTSANPSTPKMLAATVFETNPTDVEAPPKEVETCSGSVKNRRCVVAIRSCGSTELRISWTAPPKWRGPIWFSAGFVMTDSANGIPNDVDFVTEFSAPMNAAAIGEAYETELGAGCTAAPGPAGPSSWFGFVWALCGFAWLGRSRLRRTSLGFATIALCIGCGDEPGQQLGAASGDVGLFTPGYRVATSESPLAMGEDAGMGNGGSMAPGTTFACMGTDFIVPADAPPAPSGTLAVELFTDARAGMWDVTAGSRVNYGAIWIEDPTGQYVRGLKLWRGLFFLQLPVYNTEKGRLTCPEIDVMAMPTMRGHQAHKASWDGKNTKGQMVPDGNYVLWVEVQVDEHPLAPGKYPFTKGREPWMMTPPPTSPPQSSLSISYQPL